MTTPPAIGARVAIANPRHFRHGERGTVVEVVVPEPSPNGRGKAMFWVRFRQEERSVFYAEELQAIEDTKR